ncbi:MAG: AAA family ATPase [Patescibacteria group bacterium]|nr:AAA family ATPase [Patescibacteria group bacterium]
MQKSSFTIDWPLIGNKQITDFFERCIAFDKVSGTYIFNGPDNLGKTTVARHFAQSLLCKNKKIKTGNLPCGACPSCAQFKSINFKNNSLDIDPLDVHGDFHLVKKAKDKKNISISQIRELIKTLNMSSFLGSYKVGIIKHAETLSLEAANALLKTLEEPKTDVLIILITHDLSLLPKTIVSRSKVLQFLPVKFDIIYDYLIKDCRASRSEAKNYSRLCLGRPALAKKFLENKNFFEEYDNKIKIFFNFFLKDANYRLGAIEGLIKQKSNSQEQVIFALRTIEIWQGLIRDWLLLKYGLDNLIQHQIAEAELKQIKNKFSVAVLIKLNKILLQARDYLQANVNPKLALEKIALSF